MEDYVNPDDFFSLNPFTNVINEIKGNNQNQQMNNNYQYNQQTPQNNNFQPSPADFFRQMNLGQVNNNQPKNEPKINNSDEAIDPDKFFN